MPDWIAIVLLGIIEGITEFLPISSTGHLLLAEHWLPKQSELFNVVIQCGAVLAVIVVFQEKLCHMLAHWQEAETRDYVGKLAAAFLVTAIGGFTVKKLGFKLPVDATPVALALLIGGILFVAVEFALRGKKLQDTISWQLALILGAAQVLAAVFPGTSRSGATILIALSLGLARPAATEFSFLLGVPTMMAAGSLEIFHALRHPTGEPAHWGMILLGSVVSGIVAFAAVKWLLRYIQTHTFTGFGWYRIIVGALALIFWR